MASANYCFACNLDKEHQGQRLMLSFMLNNVLTTHSQCCNTHNTIMCAILKRLPDTLLKKAKYVLSEKAFDLERKVKGQI